MKTQGWPRFELYYGWRRLVRITHKAGAAKKRGTSNPEVLTSLLDRSGGRSKEGLFRYLTKSEYREIRGGSFFDPNTAPDEQHRLNKSKRFDNLKKKRLKTPPPMPSNQSQGSGLFGLPQDTFLL